METNIGPPALWLLVRLSILHCRKKGSLPVTAARIT